LSLHVPHNPETENLLNEASLRALKKGALVINTARGAVLNEDAAAKLLHDGHLGGLALDVYRDEPKVNPALLNAPRTLLLPHLGSATSATRWAMAALAEDNILAVLRGEEPKTPVQPQRGNVNA